MKQTTKRPQWFHPLEYVDRHVAAAMLGISKHTLAAMTGEGIGPQPFFDSTEGATYRVAHLKRWAKLLQCGPYSPETAEYLREHEQRCATAAVSGTPIPPWMLSSPSTLV